MAKRIKIKGKAPRIKNRPPRGLSKAERVMSNAEDEEFRLSGNPGIFGGQLDKRELIEVLKLGSGATRPSSTRKKRVKEGNRKFIGPRQFSSELAEDRGRGNLNTPSSYRSYHRQLDREILERDDPTVDVHRSNAGRGGQLRGGLSPKVVAKLKAAAKKIATKPASQMTDRERKFIRNIDAMGHYLGNYRD